jgi:hypothetical protein
MSKGAMNKYRQLPVERQPEEKEEPWKPSIPQPFEAGEELRCHFLPLFYTIPEPVKAEKVEAFKRCMSGWMVTVLDTEGKERQLDSKYFSKHKR